MNLLPKASGTRPRVACEITPEGVVAARSGVMAGPLAAVSRVELAAGAVAPGLKPGNLADRVAVVAAVRGALESVGLRSGSRDAAVTVVVPDAAVRVLLLEFDSLPGKEVEALGIVRFRLKKLLPFDADDAMVSYQVMSTSKSLVRVLAVAIPRDVLAEYESVVAEAGYLPGAVLPSTLASLSDLEDASARLMVNATSCGVTTAIVRGGILLLHRSVDLQVHTAGEVPNVPPAMFELPLVDVHETAGEWAAQEPLPEHGRDPYAEPQNGILALSDLKSVPLGTEIAQAVNVAAAYFEDTLGEVPTEIVSAGPLGAEKLATILASEGVAQADGLRVHERVSSEDLLADAVTRSVPRSWLSGVVGALRV